MVFPSVLAEIELLIGLSFGFLVSDTQHIAVEIADCFRTSQ